MIPFNEDNSLGPARLLNRKELVQIILRLQFEGWKFGLREFPGLTADRCEPFMNKCLYLGMKSVRDSLSLSNIFIVEKPTVRAETDTEAPEGEPDVTVFFSEFRANEPHAVIECKRLDPLETPKQLRGEYVRSGINRFVSGPYGRGHDLDFMIGYVLRGDELTAMKDVNLYLQNVGCQRSLLRETSEFGSPGFVAQSDHVRAANGDTFRLLHSYVCFLQTGAE